MLFGQMLDSVTLELFYNLNDSVLIFSSLLPRPVSSCAADSALKGSSASQLRDSQAEKTNMPWGKTTSKTIIRCN